jgi:hypothetical protein
MSAEYSPGPQRDTNESLVLLIVIVLERRSITGRITSTKSNQPETI